ncbi:dna-directed rna polymerase subunit alpha : DNA-directed RNA polymerase subunit alpha OS=Singulisphaera acidiphila (strain ATCC BAA-1392 / DSM 18658 / VKM B-2454 / MOB10) GN=rpoA PE=3 SV=1: RNA_pol_L: RNA_pol_A_bac: RNA_pol_A_CTD [Gemmataceae bacterium]|nr:dna-directed rna polymerase subunit alpha : DNA-directed RNA polymerase subunit alpha OS=Singulisphaera acidiphila (strain ATCC BAA-1392 / DSM 18658 / VKM B-2454 / MOB10) GN=rpoA PE=3 SV=1: RNA_pol_L: RNA_pol_A_bac: RNA_pol_A_CTD [Gemmataceae bacterium]VTU01576.1 dna-directed rna polymerase subunit alpha : DNA-directed RNA polymerase subunit alpha OS=Singulisphaera acidiphila (strain ATCC BAA-1392 / DSM 18658 / VKM B-2454 / MOB10) GN=rpoA PE=3 SV=1: RNA_pol_L: RNA_pol_A_bac: RNA_pol_A_CTD [Gemm
MRVRWRGLELPSRVHTDRGTLTDTYGKFFAEPFERGFGMTIGNSLRRILLSSLEGSAITRVKIHDVQHEISTITGVVEDVTDIILNVKSLVVKNLSDQPKVIRIQKHEAGPVRGVDVQHDEMVQIINPEHHIATLTSDVPFVMEMTVENGRGYRTAEENAGKEREIGVIPVDSSFSPVVRVKYDSEETRVGQKTNYDRLVMEIWTNGTIGPQMALVEAAKILRKHLNPFVQYTEQGPEVPLEESMEIGGARASSDTSDAELERKLNMSLAELELSVRATNCLETEGITTVRELILRSPDELLEVRNFGETTLREVQLKLQERGLTLGMRIPPRRS